MIEIKGKVNTAICYATVVEGEAIEQIRRMCDHDFTAGSQIRIMPDVHAGKGCTIGTTMTITDKVVPNIVGVDIGCGMYTAELGKVDVDFEKVDAAAHDIPSGRDVWEGRMERFDLTGLRCYQFIIYDCGVMQTPTSIFRDAEHRLLCGSVLPYEIPVFHKALSECGSLEVRPVAICVPQEIQEYCTELFGEDVQIAAASHDLFAKQVNGQIYRPLVEKYIAGEKRL